MAASDEENEVEYATESESEEPQPQQEQEVTRPRQRTMQRARQNQNQQMTNKLPAQLQNTDNAQQMMVPATKDQRVTGTLGGHTGAIRESRIKDRPEPKETRDSSLKIKIELDLEVEVCLLSLRRGQHPYCIMM
jgi:hypothetical protein